ncbi:MAG: hypothetical protein ABI624_20325 [Casimicrobiaceae bacterium]
MSEAPEPASPVQGSPNVDLRDYFAATALAALATAFAGELSYGERRAEIADQAYGLADAMLKARGPR